MDCTLHDLERLEEQIFLYKPTLKATEHKQNVSNCLRNQLVESKAVVSIQRMDAECESLMISLKQRLMLLQNILKPKEKEVQLTRNQKVLKSEDEVIKLNLSSDSSDDDETLSSLVTKHREAETQLLKHGKVKTIDMQHAPHDSDLPLALRRKPRERKLSYKSFSSSASTSHSNNRSTKLHNKQEHTVTASGVTFQSNEMLVEQEEVDTTPTLHIKIPSLYRGNVHYIILDSLNFARKVFDYRASEVKQQKPSITHSTKLSKSRKKQVKSLSTTVIEQLTQQEQELELSQLIQDVMSEACNDETLQATSALENINNNLIDNYDGITMNENLLTCSQSSQELTFSQNSNADVVDTVCSSSGSSNLQKKTRKNSKRSNEQQQHLNEPPKKRGRKPKKKDVSDDQQLQPQPPTKSNLAKYVEFFANDCELLPGSTTPAASSTRSLPLVSSTTHNFEVVDQLPQQHQQHEQQSSPQQPITYYIDGDWANGGPCQLVATNGMTVDARQINQEDMNAPFQDFVNYIDNSGDSGNNVIARVLENNNSLPISIPLPLANPGLQNKSHHPAPRQIQQQSIHNSFLPVINIQIPNLPNNIISPSAPPPAHTHKDILDLSVKSKSCTDIGSSEVLNLNQISNNNIETCCHTEEDECMPLDLSAKGINAKGKQVETHNVTIDNQDEDFIRQLIEQSDFEYTTGQMKKGCETPALTNDNDNNKSFKAALDMPLLDFDATGLSQLVENTSTASNKQQNDLTDKIIYHDSTNNNEDSNYVSMTASSENNLHFSDQTTTEIFNKLLDICPDNQFLDNISHEFISNDDLNESVFDHCRVENSTMCEMQNSTNPKHQSNEGQTNICDTTSHYANQDRENSISIDEPSSSTSTSMAVQIDSSNKTNTDLNISMSSDISINFKFASNDEQMNLKDVQSTNSDKICNDTQQTAAVDEQKVIEVENTEKTLKNNKNVQEVNCKGSASTEKRNLHNLENVDQCFNINEDMNDKCSGSPITGLEKLENIETGKQKVVAITNIIDKEINDKCSENNNKNNKDSEQQIEVKYDKYLGNSQNNKDNCEIYQSEVTEVENTETTFKSVKNKKDVNVKCLSNNIERKSKTKDNVVFSVAKVTLSDDENLYSTDSDTASGKSYDAGEVKPMAEKKDLTFNSCDITAHKSNIENNAKNACLNIEDNDSTDAMAKKPKFTENLLTPVNINENSNESMSILTQTENYFTDVINLSVSFENNSEQTFMDSDAEMKDLTIENNANSSCHNIKHTNSFDKNPKYTENDNENSKHTVMVPNETKNTESCSNNAINLSVYFNNNEREKEDSNINNEDDDVQCRGKKVPDMVNKLNAVSIDSLKNVECTAVESPKNEENLTLLELDSKLEGSLDFDEDFDDALSLATSCFDSPNDDRFEDSIVDVDTTTTASAQPPPQQYVIPDPPLNKDLKYFKIPKLNNSEATTSNITEKETDIKSLDKLNTSAATSSKIAEMEPDINNLDTTAKATKPMPKIQLLANFENITRTVKNDFVVHSKENSVEVLLVADEIPAIVHIISKVFGITCLPYLVDKCFAITHCQLSHQFNDVDTVYEYLNTLDKITVNLTYKVLYNHAKLYKVYFKVFCTYYATKNERIKLLNMVNDCERYPEYAEFIIVIYESLVKCGLSRVNACRLILKRIREITTASTILEALVAIIMKSDWTMFTDFIEKYTQEMYKFNFRIGILEQMAPAVLNSKGPHLKQVFGKCVQTLHCDDTGLLLHSPSLIQCVALLTTNT